MHIDFKVANWERVQIPEKVEDKVFELLKEKKIDCISDLQIFFDEHCPDEFFTFDLVECESEYLRLEDNAGEPTIELHKDDYTTAIWDNKNGVLEEK